jgi:hypothetical protein
VLLVVVVVAVLLGFKEVAMKVLVDSIKYVCSILRSGDTVMVFVKVVVEAAVLVEVVLVVVEIEVTVVLRYYL